jgi:hypothetical protein
MIPAFHDGNMGNPPWQKQYKIDFGEGNQQIKFMARNRIGIPEINEGAKPVEAAVDLILPDFKESDSAQKLCPAPFIPIVIGINDGIIQSHKKHFKQFYKPGMPFLPVIIYLKNVFFRKLQVRGAQIRILEMGHQVY